MKYLLSILLFCLSLTIESQTDKSENIFWDIINQNLYLKKENPEIGYLKKVHYGMLEYHLSNFNKDSTLLYYDNKVKKNDSIKLSIGEKTHIISELKKSKNYSWNLKTENDLIEIKENNILKFMKENREREFKIISKPVFIRNGEIPCVFTAHFCCGEIFGYVALSLFKKENEKWIQWIPLSQGSL